MSYLKFDKTPMTNLQDSLFKEILLTNKLGAYACTTIPGCNIRKYHGLLVVPIPELDEENHVLLSSLDETVIQHGAEFNLGLHKYQGDNFSPKGHKYIYHFDWDRVPAILYRVGGVTLKKELLFDQRGAARIMVRYTLLEAHSETTLRLKPFLAFRSVRQFTHRNWAADTRFNEEDNGISMSLYASYPTLYMQLSKDCSYEHNPDWYMGLDYPKERERGYESDEDLLVPGYFECSIKKGESVTFTASLEPMPSSKVNALWDREYEPLMEKKNFYQCLVRAAKQFHITSDGENYLIAGWPWFKCRARDMFVSMPGVTLSIGETALFETYMQTAEKALRDFMSGRGISVSISEVQQPDVLLWAVWALQQYARHTSNDACYEKYGNLLEEIMNYISTGCHPNLFLHDNGLVYSVGRTTAVTWMNSSSNGRPIVPRTGYIVEFNALWYNAQKFYAALLGSQQNEKASLESVKYEKMAERTAQSFRDTFVNEHGYLFDYVDGDEKNWSVRPNMIFPVAFDFSPLDRTQMKKVLDVCTKELVTPKGLRSLSPKSTGYNPIYAGPQSQRDFAYHQGTAWPWLMGFYLKAYLKVYKMSGLSFAERQLIGFEEELFYHCLGSLPELFDGNPPFHGRGAMSYAMNVSSILRAIRLIEQYNLEQ